MTPWVMVAWKQSEMQFFCYFGGSITQQEVIFMSNVLVIVLHYYSRYDFDSC